MPISLTRHTDFNAYRLAKKNAINAAAGVARSRYVTDIPAQSYVLQAKNTEAQAYATAGYPNPTDLTQTATYPYLCKEADQNGTDNLATTANSIISAKTTTDTALSAIEGYRLGYTIAVMTLPDDVAMIDSYANDWIAVFDTL